MAIEVGSARWFELQERRAAREKVAGEVKPDFQTAAAPSNSKPSDLKRIVAHFDKADAIDVECTEVAAHDMNPLHLLRKLF